MRRPVRRGTIGLLSRAGVLAILVGGLGLFAGCSVTSAGEPAEGPLVLVSAGTSPYFDEETTIRVDDPVTGEQVDRFQWATLSYVIKVRNDGRETLRVTTTRLVPSEAIREWYGGEDPFEQPGGSRSSYGKLPEVELAPGDELVVERSIITSAVPTDFGKQAEGPLTPNEARELEQHADEAVLTVSWDGGRQSFFLVGVLSPANPTSAPG